MILQVLVYKHLLYIFLTGFLFYAVIPGVGAFLVRHKWREFRSVITDSALYPVLDYGILRSGTKEYGMYRFFGKLQALEGENRIWLSDDSLSVMVDLADVPVYILPSSPGLTEPLGETSGYPEESPVRTKWSGIYSLPEGTKMFVFGALAEEGGRVWFTDTPEKRLFAVIYDCGNTAFFSHAVWTGRQRNEYWNPATPGSLTLGSFILFFYFYILLQMPYMTFPAGIALLTSLFPLVPFFPPGLFLYYLYRYLWKRARMLRAERDLLKLPLVFFPRGCSGQDYCESRLPSGGVYAMKKLGSGEIPPDVTVRRSAAAGGGDGENIRFFFMKTLPPGTDKRDPMAEIVAVYGDPLLLSLKSASKAFKLELLSAAAIAAGFVMNGIILFAVIIHLIG